MSDVELIPEGGWAGPDEPRLTAPKPAERGLVFRSLSRAAKRFGRSEVPDIFAVMHINPQLFWGWLFFASRLMPGGRLPAPAREKCILRTAWNCRSRYEWGQHVDIALRAGVGDEEIVALTRGPEAFSDPHAQALIQACDELFRSQCIAETTWQTLSERLDKKRRIELVMLIGHYQMVAGFLNTAGLVLEPAIEARLQAFHERVAASQEARA